QLLRIDEGLERGLAEADFSAVLRFGLERARPFPVRGELRARADPHRPRGGPGRVEEELIPGEDREAVRRRGRGAEAFGFRRSEGVERDVEGGRPRGGIQPEDVEVDRITVPRYL